MPNIYEKYTKQLQNIYQIYTKYLTNKPRCYSVKLEHFSLFKLSDRFFKVFLILNLDKFRFLWMIIQASQKLVYVLWFTG